MTAKKKTPPKVPPPKVKTYTVGKASTEKTVVHTTLDMSSVPVADFLKSLRPATEEEVKQAFNRRIAPEEEWARWMLAQPDGKKDKGDQERIALKWYARRVLRAASTVRSLMDRGRSWDAVHSAVDLGELLGERDVREYYGRKGAKPKPPRSCTPLRKYIHLRRRRDPDLTFEDFWDEMTTYDVSVETLEIDDDTEIYYEEDGEKLIADKPGKKKKELARSTVLAYWEKEKPPND